MTFTQPAFTSLLFLALSGTVAAQQGDNAARAVEIGLQYAIAPDVTYLTADGYESKLDVLYPRDRESRHPTLIYIHGGGWVGGDKDTMTLRLLPYLEMGWVVVNVEYRLARNALAPGAVEDCRCALRWVLRNAERYGFDTERLVVSGHSAGGHLSLTTGMLPASAGFDRRCPTVDPDGIGRAATHDEDMSVAAIVNWFGITDVPDLLEGENAKTYAVNWLGSMPDRTEVADRVSPLNHVRSGLPPVLTLHGDADLIVPYEHATRLHAKLDKAGVVNHLHTIAGGGHGGFTLDESLAAWDAIRAFLGEHVLDRQPGEHVSGD